MVVIAKVVKGKTDLWTTAPQIAELLLHKDDGYNLSLESHKKADFVCPNCGTIVNKIVRTVHRYGFKCPVCSDGISYPEKFMSNMLKQLNMDFLYDTSFEWSNGKRYDFYVDKLSLIIETHGIQHYSNDAIFHKDNSRSEKENDEYKRKLAISNNIKNYIELDCRYSDFDYIKNSLLNSDLSILFDLSVIDWKLLETDCLKSKVLEACDLYNSGVKSTIKIGEILNLHVSTVADYLKRCAKLQLCDYTSDKHKKIICVDTGKVYESLSSVGDDGFNTSQVSECCNNRAKTAGGYNWCFYNDYNPDTYVMKKPKQDNSPKRVMCIETGKIYERLSHVENDGFSSSVVSQICNKKNNLKTNNGCHFKFV